MIVRIKSNPADIELVRVRSDSIWYDNVIVEYCWCIMVFIEKLFLQNLCAKHVKFM